MNEQLPLDPLDARLRTVAPGFAYPPTPDIAGAVGRRLAAARPQRARVRLRLAGVVLALVLAVLATLFLVPEARAWVQNIFHIGSVEIVRVTPAPTPPVPATPGPTAIPPTAVPTWAPDLAGETTLANAQATASIPIRLPTYPPGLGPPDRVFVQDIGGPAVILVWLVPGHPDRPRLSLHALTAGMIARKMVDPSTTIQETTVNGQYAVWVSGPHMLQYRSARQDDQLRPEQLVPGNTLIWTQGTITYRLETSATITEAVKIAESVR
jgi:hypothetical protein